METTSFLFLIIVHFFYLLTIHGLLLYNNILLACKFCSAVWHHIRALLAAAIRIYHNYCAHVVVIYTRVC